MNPKFYRKSMKADKTSKCPWCAAINNHKTGQVCQHVAKVTTADIVFYYYGI